jgi:predicted NUDIX family NTP pyrophosphohydrolase
MPKISAGLLIYRKRISQLEVLLVHPGGPFYRNKDEGAWSIPKGEVTEGEDLLAAARREFAEETGVTPTGPFSLLTPVKLKSGKIIHAWAAEAHPDPAAFKSNMFTIEWPPRSGKMVEFPEVDRAEFFDVETAKRKINPAQIALIAELVGVSP